MKVLYDNIGENLGDFGNGMNFYLHHQGHHLRKRSLIILCAIKLKLSILFHSAEDTVESEKVSPRLEKKITKKKIR